MTRSCMNRVIFFHILFRYVLVLSDIQMVVCPARDIGKDVGQTDMHVVDKFTISLSLDRYGTTLML